MINSRQKNKIKKDVLSKNSRLPVVFAALGDPGRFRIFKLLMKYRNICVSDVAKIFNITVSGASQQLKILEILGLAERIRKGKMVCYQLNQSNPQVKKLKQFIEKSEKTL